MSERHSPEANPVVAAVLRAGAYGAFTLLALGAVLDLVGLEAAGLSLMAVGLIVLLATPPARILMVAVVFFRGGEPRYALVSLVVLTIVLGSWILAMLSG